MFGLGLPELIVIFLVILLLFGAKALPDIAKGLGQGIRLFKKEIKNVHQDETGIAPRDGRDQTQVKNASHDFNPDAPRRD